MKIKLSSNRQDGILLLILLVVLVIGTVGIGGCITYKLCKWSKRVNDGKPHGTNDNDGVMIPSSNGTNYARWENPRVWFEQEEQGGVGLRGASPLPTVITPITIFGWLSSSGTVLRIVRGTNEMRYLSLGDLVPLDEDGFPADLTFSSFPETNGPREEGLLANLEKTTDLVEWSILVGWRMIAGVTNVFEDTSLGKNAFYRVR